MDMFNSFTTIDGNFQLPFQLYLQVGNERKLISHLASNIKQVNSCIYEIEEYKNLTLGLITENTFDQIEVIWNTTLTDKDTDFINQFTLNKQNNKKVLFDMEEQGVYPWRCGSYLFQIKYSDNIFYGIFSVEPKNISKKQFKRIHDLLNEKIQGITNDLMKYHYALSEKSFLDKNNTISFFRWYETIEKKLFVSLDLIQRESETTIIPEYVIESIPKHLDSNSIKWQNSVKGLLYKSSKYLNRKYFTSLDTANNRVIKKRVIEFQKRLKKCKTELLNYLERLNKLINEKVHSLELLNNEKKNILNKKTITLKEKKRIETDYLNQERKLDQYYKEKDHLLHLIEKIQKLINHLSIKLEQPFWKSINHLQSKGIVTNNNKGYLLFEHIYRQSKYQSNTGGSSSFLIPAYKPTYLIYEYFVYFIVVDCLISLDFTFPYNLDLKDQLKSSIYQDGLVDGTKIIMENEERGLFVEINYNEELENNSRLAIEKSKHFFSTKFRKKPDIKVDLYEFKDDQLYFRSSFIFEVKYRPLHNIYQDKGSTSTMEQMDDYRSIRYVDKNGNIVHAPVSEVVCVYPGDDHKETLFNTDYGYFLKLFPDEHEESDAIIGSDETKKLLNAWINKHCPI